MAEEKTAEQKAADEAAAKKAADEATAAGKKTADDEKDVGEELAGKDVSKFTSEQMIDYIDKLKDENARRRISNRKLKDSQDKAEKQLQEFQASLKKAQERLDEVESEKKKKSDAEKSEVERLKSQVDEFQAKLTDMEGRVKESDKLIREKDLQIKRQSRETEVNRLLQAASVEFSSDYERKGFLSELLVLDGDGDFQVNEEEVTYRVGQFIKKTKEKKPPASETPPAGPGGRSGEPALNERIKAITSKKAPLTPEDKKELDELLELAGQAAEWDPRRTGG